MNSARFVITALAVSGNGLYYYLLEFALTTSVLGSRKDAKAQRNEEKLSAFASLRELLFPVRLIKRVSFQGPFDRLRMYPSLSLTSLLCPHAEGSATPETDKQALRVTGSGNSHRVKSLSFMTIERTRLTLDLS